jgi:hypothetical protein
METNSPVKRYFGMTMVQIGVLVLFAVLDVTVICAGIFLVGGNLLPQQAAAGAPPATAGAPTAPTVTPTPQPTAALPPGWNRFATGKVEMWLPPYFVGGDFNRFKADVIKEFRALGSEYDQLADSLENGNTNFEIYAVDSTNIQNGVMTNLNVMEDTISPLESLENYIERQTKALPSEWIVIDHSMYRHGEYEAGKIWTEYVVYGVTGRQMMYIIRQNLTTLWALTFTTSAAEFDDRLPIFEMCEATFTMY